MRTSELVKQDLMGFDISNTTNINSKAVEKVNKFLPELLEKTKAFGSKNSQTTLTLMTLNMLCGQSPYRMLRQILAETEKRKGALSEAQVSHALLLKKIKAAENKPTTAVETAKYRKNCITISTLENKINGSFRDIATLIDAYNNIKEVNGIKDWDEVAFEQEEKRHHVRRCFELMYRNILSVGRAQTATIEYCQQYGIHPQLCLTEVTGYINYAAEVIANKELPHANHLEEFLDAMTDKYHMNVDKTAERLFGKADFTNKDHMYEMMKERVRN